MCFGWETTDKGNYYAGKCFKKKNHPVIDTGELRTFCARLTLTRRSVDRSILNQRNHDFFYKGIV